jgi:hypothetical protein
MPPVLVLRPLYRCYRHCCCCLFPIYCCRCGSYRRLFVRPCAAKLACQAGSDCTCTGVGTLTSHITSSASLLLLLLLPLLLQILRQRHTVKATAATLLHLMRLWTR